MAKWCTRVVACPPVGGQYHDAERYWKRRSGGQNVETMRTPAKRERIVPGTSDPHHCAAPSSNSKE